MQFVIVKSDVKLNYDEINEIRENFNATTSIVCKNNLQYEWISSDSKTFFIGRNPDIPIYDKYSTFYITPNNELSFIHGWLKKEDEDVLFDANMLSKIDNNELNFDGFYLACKLNPLGEGIIHTSLYNPQLYYAKMNNKFAISNRISTLSKIFKLDNFNKKHLASHIQYQHTLITHDTIYENIYQIPFGSKIIISDELILNQNHDLFYDDFLEKKYLENPDKYWDECYEKVSSQVNAFKNLNIQDKLLVGISGGMDSRLLFSIFHECISSTFSWGPVYSPEVIAGRMCADEVNIPHKTPSLRMAQSSQNLLKLFPQHIFAREFEMCPWDFGIIYSVTKDTITIDGQEFIKTAPYERKEDKEKILNSVESKFSWRKYSIPEEYYELIVKEHKKNMQDFLDNIHDIQKFPFIERVLTRGRWAARVHETIFDHSFNIYPLLTNTFLKYAFNSSIESMKNQEIVYEMIGRSCPELLNIPLFNKSFAQTQIPPLENKIPGKINYKYEYLVKYFDFLKDFMKDNYDLISDIVKEDFIDNLTIDKLNEQKIRYDESLSQTIYTLLETIVLLKINDFTLLKNSLDIDFEIPNENFEDTYDDDCLKAFVEYNKDIIKLKQDIKKYKDKLVEFENSNNSLSINNYGHILFYDKGLKNDCNINWNKNAVNMMQTNEGTIVIPNSGNWFSPLVNGKDFILPNKFKIDIDLVEYSPVMKIVLLNSNGESLIKGLEKKKKKSQINHLTIEYDDGNIKYHGDDQIIEDFYDFGDKISIRIDLKRSKKLIYKEFLISIP